jgi:membrane fusion protein
MFRSQVIGQNRNRLLGDVSIAIPIAWQSVGCLVFSIVVAGAVFITFASYSRTETVSGIIAPNSGVSQIFATRNGVITHLSASDGDIVGQGDQLATIRVEEDSVSGIPAAAKIEDAIAEQDANIVKQNIASLAAAKAQQAQLAAQRDGLAAEISQLEAQVALQRSLVASAKDDVDRARSGAALGFISVFSMKQREEALLLRQQGLSQLLQTLSLRQANLGEAEHNAELLAAQSREQNAQLAATRAQLAQTAASSKGARAYVLRAPIAGRVTAVTARVGQTIQTQSSLMSIVKPNAKMQAELTVASSAIGFIKIGQDVGLAIDTFPYQRFGTIKGQVMTVATSAISQPGPNGTMALVYPVTVEIDHAMILAYDRPEQLIAGMTLTARIVTEKQRLVQWLFEALFAVQRR